jgi:hypothetical protein
VRTARGGRRGRRPSRRRAARLRRRAWALVVEWFLEGDWRLLAALPLRRRIPEEDS